jgi:hypothetical protein
MCGGQVWLEQGLGGSLFQELQRVSAVGEVRVRWEECREGMCVVVSGGERW